MTNEQLIARIAEIKQSHPDNLMARYFDAAYYGSLDAPLQMRLRKIIASGVQNPNSSMGAYAMAPDDYAQFAPMLDAMIRDFHGIPDGTPIAQPHDWDTSAVACDLGAIDAKLKEVSMRVRVARNVASFPLPGAMSKDQRVAFEDVAAAAFAKLAETPEFGGQYLSITPGSPYEIDGNEYDRRVAAHHMFKDMSGRQIPECGGHFGRLALWPWHVCVGGTGLFGLGWRKGPLRIMSMQTGGNLNPLVCPFACGG